MFDTQKSMDKLKAGLIRSLGKDLFDNNIVDIADMINDLEYKQVDLSIKHTVILIQEIVTEKTKKYWRQIFRNEFANHDFHKPPQWRKWRWMSSAEKIKFLLLIKEMRAHKVLWKKISWLLKINAKETMRNVVRGNVYASELMRLVAHQIWEKRDKRFVSKQYR